MSALPAERSREPGAVDVATAYAHCARVARTHYENFTIGSWLLPRRLRQDLAAVYAFARGADDIADEGEPTGRLEQLQAWEEKLRACARHPDAAADPVFLALGHTIPARAPRGARRAPRERGLPGPARVRGRPHARALRARPAARRHGRAAAAARGPHLRPRRPRHSRPHRGRRVRRLRAPADARARRPPAARRARALAMSTAAGATTPL